MAETLNLRIYSPERKLLDGVPVREVTLPGSEGEIQIYPEHARMVGSLETGPFRFTDAKGQSKVGVISAGFFEIREDEVYVMAETLELSHEIDVSRARQAQESAEEALQRELEPGEFDVYETRLRKAVIRQRVASDSK